MNKKSLDEKYSYQIDEHYIVHLFRGEDDCQQYLTNPLLSAIFKIEQLAKENAELKKTVLEIGQHLDMTEREWGKDMSKMIHYKTQATKAKELLNEFLDFESSCMERGIYISDKIRAEAEQFLNSEVEK